LEKFLISQNERQLAPPPHIPSPMRTGSKFGQMIPIEAEAFSPAIKTNVADARLFRAAMKSRRSPCSSIASRKITGGDEARGQLRDFAFLCINNFVRGCSLLIGLNSSAFFPIS